MKNHDINIRIATVKDAEQLLKIYAPYVESTAITFEYEVPSVEEFAGRIKHVLSKYPYLVAEQDGELLGYAYVSSFKERAAYAWAVETSIYVDQKARNKGIGGKLLHTLETILKEGLSSLGLDTGKIPQLMEFSRLLLEKNKVMNLTAITEPENVATLHLLDCAYLLTLADYAGKAVIDVGTGAGFPGMPMGILRRDFPLTLLDSLGKRIDFLRESVALLGLENISCIHARAEDFAAGHRESYDVAVSRAVAALPMLCELALPLVKSGGLFLAMKSVDSDDEIAAARGAIGQLGGKVERIHDYAVPCTEVKHRVVMIRKVRPTPAQFPRPFARIKKSPLK